THNRGWFIPAGTLDAGETVRACAIRECLEETNVPIKLCGILEIRRTLVSKYGTKRTVVWYAEPTEEYLDSLEQLPQNSNQDLRTVPKPYADENSLQARWMTLEEYSQLSHIRGPELLEWGEYIEKNQGPIWPLEVFQEDIEYSERAVASAAEERGEVIESGPVVDEPRPPVRKDGKTKRKSGSNRSINNPPQTTKNTQKISSSASADCSAASAPSAPADTASQAVANNYDNVTRNF
ncbi:unnamed protein product, partial [Amoebophrya sp. A25]